jgi:hypothetical protein
LAKEGIGRLLVLLLGGCQGFAGLADLLVDLLAVLFQLGLLVDRGLEGSAFQIPLDGPLEVFQRLVGLLQDAFDFFRIRFPLFGYVFDQGLEVGFAGQLAFLVTASDLGEQVRETHPKLPSEDWWAATSLAQRVLNLVGGSVAAISRNVRWASRVGSSSRAAR